MNFYTLTYDANLPTTQQINVPTNTDYKVGVKVRRNGEILDLDPADVTLGSLSADAELEDGYVTFTKAAGDEASYTPQALSIKHEPSVFLAAFIRNKTQSNFPISFRLDYTGLSSFDLEDILVGIKTDPNSQPISADVDTLSGAIWPPNNAVVATTRVILPYAGMTGPSYYQFNQTAYNALYTLDPSDPALSGYYVEELPPRGTPIAGKVEVGETKMHIVQKVSVYEGANFSKTYAKTRTEYATAVVKILDSKPIDLKFKLNENIFKSQVGDLADISFDNTINIAGTLSDDTEFSYNALVK